MFGRKQDSNQRIYSISHMDEVRRRQEAETKRLRKEMERLLAKHPITSAPPFAPPARNADMGCNLSDEDSWCYDHKSYRCWNEVCPPREIDDETKGNWHTNIGELVLDIVPSTGNAIRVAYDPMTWKYAVSWLDSRNKNKYGFTISDDDLASHRWEANRVPAQVKPTSSAPQKVNPNGAALRRLRARSGD